MDRCLETTPWGNSDVGVALGTPEVKTSIISSIFGQMGQVRFHRHLRKEKILMEWSFDRCKIHIIKL